MSICTRIISCITYVDDLQYLSKFVYNDRVLKTDALCRDEKVRQNAQFAHAFYKVFLCYPSQSIVHTWNNAKSSDFATYIRDYVCSLPSMESCKNAFQQAVTEVSSLRQVYDALVSTMATDGNNQSSLTELFLTKFKSVEEYMSRDSILHSNIKNLYWITKCINCPCIILHKGATSSICKATIDVYDSHFASNKVHVFNDGQVHPCGSTRHLLMHKNQSSLYPLFAYACIIHVTGNDIHIDGLKLETHGIHMGVSEVLKIIMKCTPQQRSSCVKFWSKVMNLWDLHSIHDVSFEPNMTESRNGVIAVDTRENPLLVNACFLTTCMLKGNFWKGITIFCPMEKVKYYTSHVPFARVKALPNLPLAKFDIDDYNDIMKSYDFWHIVAEEEGYDKVLIIQDDGFLIRKGVERFLEYDYVGAPWIEPQPLLKTLSNPYLVGNGGLSIRSVKAMLEIAQEEKHRVKEMWTGSLSQLPEDVFFAHHVYNRKHYIVCPRDIAFSFASEEISTRGTCGVHKPWPYLSSHEIDEIFK